MDWETFTDSLPNATGSGNIACGAIAIGGRTLYLGLGDPFGAKGRGLYKIENWTERFWIELGAIGRTTAIHAILPLDENVILVGGNAGLWRSNNGGRDFGNIGIGTSTGDKIWSIQRLGLARDRRLVLSKQPNGDFPQCGNLWYSGDEGASWTQATVTTHPWEIEHCIGRLRVGATTWSATRAYAVAEIQYTDRERPHGQGSKIAPGLLVTTDGGQNWSTQPTDHWGNQKYAWYTQSIVVHPNDEQKVYVGLQLNSFANEAGGDGARWRTMTDWVGANRIPYAHADYHALKWFYFPLFQHWALLGGNDGGVVYHGRAWPTSRPDNSRNKNLVTHLVYAIGSTAVEGWRDKVSLGTQDNGLRISLGNEGRYDEVGDLGDATATVWHTGDGRKVLAASYHTNIYRSVDGGASVRLSVSGIEGAGSDWTAPFLTRLALGRNADTAYTATLSRAYKSTDFGANWTAISPSSGTPIRNINGSRSNEDAVAVVTREAVGGVTYDGGRNWRRFGVPPEGANPLAPSYVWFDTRNDQVLYLTSVSLDESKSHIWKSTDRGASWNALDEYGLWDNGFPYGIPVHVVQNDPRDSNTLYVGTDFGVYSSTDGGANWSRFGTGMPMVRVTDLWIAPDGGLMRAATYGRGAWEIRLPAPTPTPTRTSTPTHTPTETPTPTPTPSWSETPTETMTPTETPEQTTTPTETPAGTSPTATDTPVSPSPTETATPEPTVSAIPTTEVTSSASIGSAGSGRAAGNVAPRGLTGSRTVRRREARRMSEYLSAGDLAVPRTH